MLLARFRWVGFYRKCLDCQAKQFPNEAGLLMLNNFKKSVHYLLMCLTLFNKKNHKEFYSCSCYFYIVFSTFIDVVIDVIGVLVELMPLLIGIVVIDTFVAVVDVKVGNFILAGIIIAIAFNFVFD